MSGALRVRRLSTLVLCALCTLGLLTGTVYARHRAHLATSLKATTYTEAARELSGFLFALPATHVAGFACEPGGRAASYRY